MHRKILSKIALPPFDNQVKFVSYKIMPRAQNAHALVNAGFLFKFEKDNSLKSVTIVYGNISQHFVHAHKTEEYLSGKKLFDNSVLQQAYQSLDKEINPENMPPESSPKFRNQLAIALFYKAVLSLAPDGTVSARNKSGATVLTRPVSQGTQDYDTDKTKYPLTKALPKIEAVAQTSGEAVYVEDLPDLPHQLYGALVLAKSTPNSTITKIDASKALRIPGIVAFYTKDDIPGENTFSMPIPPVSTTKEELFCSGKVKYYDQPVGVLIGKDQRTVEEASDLIDITHSPSDSSPLLTIRDVLKSGQSNRIEEYKVIQPTKKGTDVKHVIKGSLDIYHQYHFHMETQCCRVDPEENSLIIDAATQSVDILQYALSQMLNIPMGQIEIVVRRCGGAFGGKLTRSGLTTAAAALAAWKLKKPVKLRLSLTTNMTAIGKRFPCSADYEVGVNDSGVVQYLDCSVYTDCGCVSNGDVFAFTEGIMKNTYTSDTYKIRLSKVFTDTHTNTWMRAPGSAEGLAVIESIMEHISYAINVDPVQIRLANLPQDSPLINYINDMKTWVEYDHRLNEIQTFNKENRWKKKGFALVPMNFGVGPIGPPHQATVSIFHGDGSVQITHGGIEIGQGINTKAAQVCAYKLNIPLEQIKILPTNSFVAPNNLATGGTIATDGVCYAVEQACDKLLKRLEPFRSSGAAWKDVISKAFEENVQLTASGKYSPIEPGVQKYPVYGVAAAEVVVDILTGQHIITSVHINEDTGRSLNPYIDIGQIEGGFVMGVGYYVLEEIKFSPEGRVLTDSTWTYYPPGALDIPLNFYIKFPKNNPNPKGVLKSKGTGEPAFCLGISVLFAIKNAVSSARKDASTSNTKWFKIDGPSVVPNVFLNSLNNYEQYTL